MRIEQLRYLVDLEETRSISKSAARFFIAQQTLSESIKAMEQELKCPLLYRSNRGVELTPEAIELLRMSHGFLSDYDKLLSAIQSRQNADRRSEELSEIRIGVFSTLADILLPKCLPIFQKKHPYTKLKIYEESYHNIFSAMANQKYDCCFFSINSDFFNHQREIHPEVKYALLGTDTLVGCLSKKWDKRGLNAISNDELNEYILTQLNVVGLEDNPEYVNESITYRSGNVNFHRNLMLHNKAICIMPKQVANLQFHNSRFIIIPIHSSKQIILNTVLYADAEPHPTILDLINPMEDLIQKQTIIY